MNLYTEFKTFKKVSCIYKITTVHDNLVYIGSALSFKKRMKDHKNSLLHKKHHNYKMQNAFNKYGKNNFVVEIVKEYENTIKLNSVEILFLQSYSFLIW